MAMDGIYDELNRITTKYIMVDYTNPFWIEEMLPSLIRVHEMAIDKAYDIFSASVLDAIRFVKHLKTQPYDNSPGIHFTTFGKYLSDMKFIYELELDHLEITPLDRIDTQV